KIHDSCVPTSPSTTSQLTNTRRAMAGDGVRRRNKRNNLKLPATPQAPITTVWKSNTYSAVRYNSSGVAVGWPGPGTPRTNNKATGASAASMTAATLSESRIATSPCITPIRARSTSAKKPLITALAATMDNSNNGSFTAAYNACSGARHKPKTNPYDAPEQTVSITAQSAIFGNSRPDRTHATSASSSRHNEATLSSRGAVSLLAATGARMTRSQLVAQRPTPMRQEELFFAERDALEWTDDWPQVGRELQHHDDEHHVPGPQDAGAVARGGQYATGQRQSKTRAHEQHQQVQKTHEAR